MKSLLRKTLSGWMGAGGGLDMCSLPRLQSSAGLLQIPNRFDNWPLSQPPCLIPSPSTCAPPIVMNSSLREILRFEENCTTSLNGWEPRALSMKRLTFKVDSDTKHGMAPKFYRRRPNPPPPWRCQPLSIDLEAASRGSVAINMASRSRFKFPWFDLSYRALFIGAKNTFKSSSSLELLFRLLIANSKDDSGHSDNPFQSIWPNMEKIWVVRGLWNNALLLRT